MQVSLANSLPGWVEGIRPKPDFDLSSWSDEYRLLNQKSAAAPGRWRTSRTPYLREPMDCLSAHSPVQRVTLMKGAQVGGTEFGNNWVGYTIDHDPGSMLIVQPTLELAKLWSRQRLSPMIDDMDCLRAKIADSRSRDSGNTVMLKQFPGGMLRVAGANSAASLRSMPVKKLLLDETDAYPPDVSNEGDPVELAMNRTKTFRRRKILEISTPTTSGLSRIERSFLQGTQSYYFIPCPHCGEFQVITLSALKWQKDKHGAHDPKTVELVCQGCAALIPESAKTEFLENGEWRETNANEKHKSYQISTLYSPIGWESWAEIVEKFLKSLGNDELKKTFRNTIEGLPYKEKGKNIEPTALQERAEDYKLGICPRGCLVLTAGVDVQDNRLEVYVWGHGARERWQVDFAVFYGSPAHNGVWRELDDYLLASFDHAAGTRLKIAAACVDSGGHHTQKVYDFCRLRKTRHVIAVKGASVRGKPILGRPSKVDVSIGGTVIKNGAEVWPVGTDTAKDMIYSLLDVEECDAEGYIHLSKQSAPEFFSQLVAEEKGRRYVKGFPIYEWQLPRGKRNEALDCFVYALAAYWLMGLHRWRPAQWEQLEARVQPPTGDLFQAQSDAERAADVADQVDQVDRSSVAPEKPAKKRKSRAAPRRRSLRDRLNG